MPRAYSEDLRIRLIRLVEKGISVRKASELLNVSVNTAHGWMRQWRKSKKTKPSTIRGHRPALLTRHTEWLLKLVKETPGLTLERIRALLDDKGVRVSLWTIWSFCQKHQIKLKRARKLVQSQTKKRIQKTNPTAS